MTQSKSENTEVSMKVDCTQKFHTDIGAKIQYTNFPSKSK